MAQNLISIDAASLNTTPRGKVQYFVDTIGFCALKQVKPTYFTTIDKQVLSLDFQKESVWVYLKALNKLENDGFFLVSATPLLIAFRLTSG
ncbi:MAG: hypothetical protein U5L96_02615 [Owenweeksia sp.]|nr:hypothetical protein [Owenweeksia sp.]